MNIGMTCWAKSEVLSERIYGEKGTHAKKVLRIEPFPEKRRVIVLGTSYRSTGIVKPIYDHEENDNDYVLVLADEVRHRVIVCQEIDKGQRYRIPFVTFESELEQIPEAGDKSMMRANYEFLIEGKDQIWELLIQVGDDFDGSEYQQGKKDGLRTALALLGNVELRPLIRGGGMARPQGPEYPVCMYELEREQEEDGDIVVVQRGVFNAGSLNMRIAWYVSRDGGTRNLIAKAPNIVGTWWFENVYRDQDLTPFLWDSPQEVFEWWTKNRKNIAAFQADRMRLLTQRNERRESHE